MEKKIFTSTKKIRLIQQLILDLFKILIDILVLCNEKDDLQRGNHSLSS